jgi:hypothetical protein
MNTWMPSNESVCWPAPHPQETDAATQKDDVTLPILGYTARTTHYPIHGRLSGAFRIHFLGAEQALPLYNATVAPDGLTVILWRHELNDVGGVGSRAESVGKIKWHGRGKRMAEKNKVEFSREKENNIHVLNVEEWILPSSSMHRARVMFEDEEYEWEFWPAKGTYTVCDLTLHCRTCDG